MKVVVVVVLYRNQCVLSACQGFLLLLFALCVSVSLELLNHCLLE